MTAGVGGHLVVAVHGVLATVELDGAAVRCAPRPGLDCFPVVGDRVDVAAPAGSHDPPAITRVLPRRGVLARLRADRKRRSAKPGAEQVLAANVELAMIVVAVARPPFHPRLIDRYMVLAQKCGIPVGICVNKCDLGREPRGLALYRDLGLPTVAVSARTGEGLERLRHALAGKTAVLTGHSGVGKSSLVNALLAEDRAATGEVGGRRGQGRHLTSAAALYRLGAATAIVDTPGLRSLSLRGIDDAELAGLFPDFAGFAPDCRFRDCRHDHEPGCGVRAAAARGDIPPARYDTYLRIVGGDR